MTDDRRQMAVEKIINQKFLRMFHGARGPHSMGDLLELALLSSKFYPRP
jgi:hypothetical protein